MGGVAFEERQFDAVVPDRLEFAKKRKMLSGDVSAPEQHVEAKFHGRTPTGSIRGLNSGIGDLK
jgi:hypothetical protein